MVDSLLPSSATRSAAREPILSATSRSSLRVVQVLLSAGLIVLAGCSDDRADRDMEASPP